MYKCKIYPKCNSNNGETCKFNDLKEIIIARNFHCNIKVNQIKKNLKLISLAKENCDDYSCKHIKKGVCMLKGKYVCDECSYDIAKQRISR